jgi:CheY-like chemotaxis protein
MILSDIGLPDVDGYTFLQQIRMLEAKAKRKAIPAVALTAYSSPQDRHNAAEAGYVVHLAKPIDPEELMEALASLLP